MANDICANATVITSFPHTQDANANAPDLTHVPSCAFDGAQQNHAAWFRWVADVDGDYILSTVGSMATDTLLSIWTGSCGALVQGGCSEDDFLYQSTLAFTAVLGTEYYIKVSGFYPDDNAIYTLSLVKAEVQGGDLIVGNGLIYVYDGVTGAGKAIWPLPVTSPTATFPDIGAQNAAGVIHIPIEIPDTIAKYGLDGGLIGTFGSELSTPHCLAFDRSDRLYVGYVGDGIDVRDACGDIHGGDQPPTSGYKLRRFVAEALDATFDCAIENGGTAHMDLMADQSTMLYTSLGRTVFAYDVEADVQLPHFATLPPATNGEILRGIRILPDGSVLVSDKINVKRLSAAGEIIQTYSLDGQDDWGVLALTPNAQQFWVANRADAAFCPPMIAKFDVATGALLQTITAIPDTEGDMCSGGVMVYNGFRAAAPPQAIVTAISHSCGTDQMVVSGVGFDDAPVVEMTRNGEPFEAFEIASHTATAITVTLTQPFEAGTYCAHVDDGPTACFLVTCAGPPTPNVIQDRTIRRVRQLPYVANDTAAIIFDWAQLDCTVGIGLIEGQGDDPVVYLSYSDDNGRTFSDEEPMSMGALAEYLASPRWSRLGTAFSGRRIFRLVSTEPVDLAWLELHLGVRPGTRG